MTGTGLASAARIRQLIDAELAALDPSDRRVRNEIADFRAALAEPSEVTVTFSGGGTRTCWQVTRPNGPYTVVFMPQAGYFSLCVASIFGPVDIGVHGRAIDCYASV